MLGWSGEAVPGTFMPDLANTLHGACIALARRAEKGATVELPPFAFGLVEDGELTHSETVLWSTKLVTTEAAFGGIGGCVFQISTRFKNKPLEARFLIPHRDLRLGSADSAEAWA